MLVLDTNYQNAIKILGYNADAFPLTYLAQWGSSVTFDTVIKDVTFQETIIQDVINTDDAKQISVVSSVDETLVVSEISANIIESSIDTSEIETNIDTNTEIEENVGVSEVESSINKTEI